MPCSCGSTRIAFRASSTPHVHGAARHRLRLGAGVDPRAGHRPSCRGPAAPASSHPSPRASGRRRCAGWANASAPRRDRGIARRPAPRGALLSHARRGAHDASLLLREIAPRHSSMSCSTHPAGTLSMVTIAPDSPGAMDAIAPVRREPASPWRSATPMHSADRRSEGCRRRRERHDPPVQWNASAASPRTRTGRGGTRHRRIVLELIADGHHVDDVAIDVVRAAARGRYCLVSDAMSATGLGDGSYELAGSTVVVRAGVAMLADGSSLAGSTTPVGGAVMRLLERGVPLDELVAATSSTPARALGLADPTLIVGARADLVELHGSRISRVMRAGSWLRAARRHAQSGDRRDLPGGPAAGRRDRSRSAGDASRRRQGNQRRARAARARRRRHGRSAARRRGWRVAAERAALRGHHLAGYRRARRDAHHGGRRQRPRASDPVRRARRAARRRAWAGLVDAIGRHCEPGGFSRDRRFFRARDRRRRGRRTRRRGQGCWRDRGGRRERARAHRGGRRGHAAAEAERVGAARGHRCGHPRRRDRRHALARRRDRGRVARIARPAARHRGGARLTQPGVPGVSGNPTGAGDAATAGLVSALAAGLGLPDALRRAAVTGAAAVLSPVAGEIDATGLAGLESRLDAPSGTATIRRQPDVSSFRAIRRSAPFAPPYDLT